MLKDFLAVLHRSRLHCRVTMNPESQLVSEGRVTAALVSRERGVEYSWPQDAATGGRPRRVQGRGQTTFVIKCRRGAVESLGLEQYVAV